MAVTPGILTEGDTDTPITALGYDLTNGMIFFNPGPRPDGPTTDVKPVPMPNTVPKISVVILSHRPKMLHEALDSVTAQTVPNIQVMVQHSAVAWPTKLNEAVNATTGEWVIILCDDDQLDPTYIERCIPFTPHADIIYTDRRVFQDGQDPREGMHFRMHGEDVKDQAAFGVKPNPHHYAFGVALPMTCMIRRDWWDKLHGHDPDMPHSDTEFWYRSAVEEARCIYIPEPLFWYREHAGQYSKTHNFCFDALVAFHRKHFLHFGVAFDQAIRVSPTQWYIPVVPPADREHHHARHLLTVGA